MPLLIVSTVALSLAGAVMALAFTCKALDVSVAMGVLSLFLVGRMSRIEEQLSFRGRADVLSLSRRGWAL